MRTVEKILVTGDVGYIGSVLTEVLCEQSFSVKGLDTGFYKDCLLSPSVPAYSRAILDLRDITVADLNGIDAVIHLAGLSNDPLGELIPGITEEINYLSTVRLAEYARLAGVKRFIYASSQSMYGIAAFDEELDEDDSAKNPLTAYAATKWQAEQQLVKMSDASFTVVCFRPSTVFGASPRLRTDIVFNNLVACAYTTGRIEIKSDGTPWRPVVHIRDVCSAFIAGLIAPSSLVGGRSFNVGIPGGNFTVRELAEAAQRAVPGSSLTFTGEHGSDSRTYRVSFKRILAELHDYYKPAWDLDRGGKELVDFFRATGFTEQQFRGAQTNRLVKLRSLMDQSLLDEQLRWKTA